MKLLREYIKELVSAYEPVPSSILIPPPPKVSDRILELEDISRQYHDRLNPEELQHVLDSDMGGLFDSILINNGYPTHLPLIKMWGSKVEPHVKFHKLYFGMPRPQELADTMGIPFESDFLESAQTPSYPSGHTAQAIYIALNLSSIYPELSESFFKAADMVSTSRIDRGVHFPSDIEGGKNLALALYSSSR